LFNPVNFDAAAWVATAKAAGMRYITITSKHHDGFAMYDSKVTDWDIVDRTPYKRDVLKQLADECKKQGLKLFFYHSLLDWHHPDYFPRGRTGRDTDRPESGAFDKYLDFMNAQLTELLTHYGPVAGIWFDGWWDRKDADWRLDRTYALIHKLQPAALVGNNHHRAPFPGEDFQMFEKDLPGQNTTGFSGDTAATVGQLPLETCETINGAWGWNIADRKWKSAQELVRYLVRAAGSNANFLLNVGPQPNGKLQPEQVERLKQMGAWLKVNGESVYGTRGGPIPPRPWGVTTRRDKTVYLHVFDWSEPRLFVPSVGAVKAARALKGGAALKVEEVAGGLLVELPPRDPYDTVVALELK
ncbi:MAG TPA: alpha-L-fucosidase, partial [Polyangia bacterium]|nr:alpha-L-fucosidase [Polyangia bacterium]